MPDIIPSNFHEEQKNGFDVYLPDINEKLLNGPPSYGLDVATKLHSLSQDEITAITESLVDNLEMRVFTLQREITKNKSIVKQLHHLLKEVLSQYFYDHHNSHLYNDISEYQDLIYAYKDVLDSINYEMNLTLSKIYKHKKNEKRTNNTIITISSGHKGQSTQRFISCQRNRYMGVAIAA